MIWNKNVKPIFWCSFYNKTVEDSEGIVETTILEDASPNRLPIIPPQEAAGRTLS